MKKTLLLSIFSFSVIGLTAQITLTSADIASPTKAIRQANDTMPTVTIGNAGASQTWNMLALNNHTEDTLVFLPNSSSPPPFASANIALKFGFQNAYAYLSNTASAATILGSAAVVDFGGGPSQVVVVNTPAEKLANWPATYNSTFTNVYSTKSKYYFGVDPGIGVPIDSVRTHGKVNKTVVFDAWGTIATPLGTYPVLRAKTTKITRDSTDAYVAFLGGWQDNVATSADSTASYTWWANGIGFPLVELTLDSLGGIREATWLQALPMTVGVNECTTAVDLNVYPNPAQNEVNFMVDSKIAHSMVIYDITGRKVDSFMITSDLSTINTSAYANGSYTYSVLGLDNIILARGKFSVAK
ncbi:MAG: hypothetical protein K0S44_964 [Bacteroidetes bacterium]|jgi:hypothetical protein|nr:hypothetical protein [Bacteroidota bacterium]